MHSRIKERARPILRALVNLLVVSSCADAGQATPSGSNAGPAVPAAVTPNSSIAGSQSAAPTAKPAAAQPPTAAAMGGGPDEAMALPATPSAQAPATPSSDTVAAATEMPCLVSETVAAKCGTCHGATPIGGAPMPLVTYADFMKPASTMPGMKVHELVKLRLHDAAKPMPPGGMLQSHEMAALDNWLDSGALPAPAGQAACTKLPERAPITRLEPGPGETCYDFKVHASTTSVDDAPYDVGQGEHYEQFYYKAPWVDGSVATSFGGDYDNLKVLHHWLLFSTSEDQPEGAHITAPLPTLNGVNAQMLAGWAVGGPTTVLPKDVGFQLPPKGGQLNVQWHFYNSTNEQQFDKSSVQVCTVPPGTRPHTAAVTWVGTEDLNGNVWLGGPGMPAKQESKFSGTCNPSRAGMDANEPIHIIGFTPHMHRIGTNAKATVNKKDGTKEVIFDNPFDFNYQVAYTRYYDLQPGDTLTAECTFNNTNNFGVPFGESSDSEMCYLFTVSWPARALDNGVPSLIGATNTCW